MGVFKSQGKECNKKLKVKRSKKSLKMCCNNRTRERWVVALVILGCIFSALVATFLVMVTHPGDECLLFISVRGEALIYGHPAGCRFISVAHIMVIVASFAFGLTLTCCTQRQRTQGTVGSNKTLRGSMTAVSVDGIRSKPTVSLIVLSLVITMLVLITTIVLVSGYVVTCGELQYETRRQIYGSQTLGTALHNPVVTCFSIFRDADLHTRLHHDHYELAGSWHGQYTAYRHGRPHVWTGDHEHGIELALGIELSVASSLISAVMWIAITWILILHRKSVKARNRLTVAESIEDAKIWAADNATVAAQQAAVHQYEMLSRQQGSTTQSVHNPYESLGGSIVNGHQSRIQSAMSGPPAPPSDASTVDAMIAHQSVIAHSHPDGSFFMTNNGTYVQLVNGVLTNVQVAPPTQPQVPVQYMQLQFPHQQHQQFPQQHPQQQQQFPRQQQQQQQHMQQQFGSPAQPLSSLPLSNPPSNPPSQPSSLVGTSSSLTQPLMPKTTSASPSKKKQEQEAEEEEGLKANTRMNMRRQKDIAAMAGIKCSQF